MASGDARESVAQANGARRRAARRPWLMAILFGLLMFLCSLALDVLFLYQHESTGLTVTVSDALAGLVAGVLAWRLLRFEAERRSRMEERLVVISDMNHHIRNALQVISYSAQGSRSQQELAGIMDSVDR